MTTDLTNDPEVDEDDFEWDVFVPDPDEAELAAEAAALDDESELNLDDSDFDWEGGLQEDSELDGTEGQARGGAAFDRIVDTVRRNYEDPEAETDLQETADLDPALEPEPEPEPEPTEREPETMLVAERGPEPEAGVEIEPDAEIETEAEIESATELEPGWELETESALIEPEPAIEPGELELETDLELEVDAELEAETGPGPATQWSPEGQVLESEEAGAPEPVATLDQEPITTLAPEPVLATVPRSRGRTPTSSRRPAVAVMRLGGRTPTGTAGAGSSR